MKDEIDQSDLNFWQEQLSGNLPVLELPLSHRRMAYSSYVYEEFPFQLPLDSASRMEDIAERENTALSMVYLTAFAILLSRYGNAQEVLIGFENSAVLRAHCVPEYSFSRMAHELEARVSAIRQHQEIPLASLAKRLSLPVTPGRAPVCDVRFQWNSEAEGTPDDGPFDLILSIREEGDGIAPSFRCRKDLFGSSLIRRMCRHFQQLVQSIVLHVESPIASLDMLSADERALLLGHYAGSSAAYPKLTLHELFTEQAAQRPDAEALVFGADRLTYQQLDLRSNQVARFLRRLGIQHEERIGIFMDRSANMVVSMLGILKAGGTYVPIDPDYPAERLKFIADDTQVRCVFTEKTVHAKFRGTAPLVYLDAPDSAVFTCSSQPVPNISGPGSIAVAIYTSGSTGKPKAACLPHRGAIRTVRNTNIVNATARDRISQVASPSFDAAILEIWGALTNGGALIGVRKEVLLDPAALTELVRAERITILFVNTTYLHQIGRTTPEVFKGIRKVLFGGEAAEPGPIRNILRHVPPGVLVNLYGPAENSVASSCYEIHSVAEDATTISIGRPVTNSRMYILDRQMHLVPIGVQGEIYVGGDGLARGYWNRPELTAQKFVRNPFSDDPEAMLYRTGDLGRIRENGEFEFLGRIDDQIKIRGHRIEVAEVREAILSHTSVKEVALLVREDEPGDRRLVAYITLAGPLTSPEESVRAHAKTKLPAYMVPAAFVILDALPVNANGKVDRKALPAPSSRPDMAKGYSAPRNPLEQTLGRVWCELLGVDLVGIHDNFFDLGGHSLLAARLVAQIEKATGHNIPVATLFAAPTIAGLARKLEDRTYTSAWSPLVELRAPAVDAAAPPFFCVHSLGANLASFHKLATLLRGDRAVYGLQPHGLDGKQQPLDTIDAMAAAYLDEIRKKQPRGPYYLGGICLGGVIAYEIARRLQESGEEVRLLALMDCFMPGEPQFLHNRSKWTEYLDFHFGEFLLLSGMARLKYVAKWIGNGCIRLGRGLGLGSHDSVTRATRHVAKANLKAMLGYSPLPYPGKITQLMCSDWAERAYEDRRLAWSSQAEGGFEIRIVPGNHLTMVEEPHVRMLARELQRALDRAGDVARPVQSTPPDKTMAREKSPRGVAQFSAAA